MKKFLLVIGSITIAIAIAFFGILAYGVHRLGEEDRIPHAYFPMLNAIADYCETNQRAPESLEALVPRYLPAIPSNVMSEIVTYRRMTDETNWTLSIETSLRQERLIFFQSSNQSDHPPWCTNEVGWIHAWRVFKRKNGVQQSGPPNHRSPLAPVVGGR